MRDKLHVSSCEFCSGKVDTLCNQILANFWKFLFSYLHVVLVFHVVLSCPEGWLADK